MPLAIKLQHMRHDVASERSTLAQQAAAADVAASAGELDTIKQQARTPLIVCLFSLHTVDEQHSLKPCGDCLRLAMHSHCCHMHESICAWAFHSTQ